MNTKTFHLAALCTLLLAAGAAQADTLCKKPPTRIDRRACEAAKQSPQALRLYIQRMSWLHHNLSYYDYVDEQTQANWDRAATRMASGEESVAEAPAASVSR